MIQDKSTTKPPFNPTPLTIQSKTGNRITASFPNGTHRTRDANQFKKITRRDTSMQLPWDQPRSTNDYANFDIDCDINRLSPIVITSTPYPSNATTKTSSQTTVTGLVTRSHGAQLNWNRTMNSKQPVVTTSTV